MSRLRLVLKWTIILAALTYSLFYLIRLGYQKEWTGFGDYFSPKGDFQREKTLWDWIDLIIAPLVLSLLLAYVNYVNKQNEERSKYDIKNIQKTLEYERLRIEQNIKIQQEQEQEKTRESLLQKYFDQVGELLLNHDLHNAGPNSKTANIVRLLTVAIIRSLDIERKSRIIQFLYDTNLIFQNNTIVNLENTDFSGIVLQGKFDGINLRYVNMQNSTFKGCSLKNANLEGAFLIGADLSNTKLLGASLKDADLGFGVLTGAVMENSQLEKVSTLRGAIMPSGDLYDGRYQLQGDIAYALSQNVELSDEEVSSIWYSHVDTNFNREELDELKKKIKKP